MKLKFPEVEAPRRAAPHSFWDLNGSSMFLICPSPAVHCRSLLSPSCPMSIIPQVATSADEGWHCGAATYRLPANEVVGDVRCMRRTRMEGCMARGWETTLIIPDHPHLRTHPRIQPSLLHLPPPPSSSPAIHAHAQQITPQSLSRPSSVSLGCDDGCKSGVIGVGPGQRAVWRVRHVQACLGRQDILRRAFVFPIKHADSMALNTIVAGFIDAVWRSWGLCMREIECATLYG
ncbi:hypothetical protein ARMSODRAFT_784445 [Armillaria solidipes]|uniref:Uncharacterized protein n=1 Tax=Armillaria solidipes TaxID=1076256 RepID=A0A2H3BRT6_9AGAR|nr:hypothetical protein ARMSODRAFT_784445 [Armillaria solidipes]